MTKIQEIYNLIDKFDDLLYMGNPPENCTKEVLIYRINEYKSEMLEIRKYLAKEMGDEIQETTKNG